MKMSANSYGHMCSYGIMPRLSPISEKIDLQTKRMEYSEEVRDLFYLSSLEIKRLCMEIDAMKENKVHKKIFPEEGKV
jgi:hypothetical protein